MRILVLGIVIFFGLIILRATDFKEIESISNIDFARKLYDKVNNTLPSVVSAKENESIIRDRLECYAENSDYMPRIRLCNNNYAKALVKQARSVLTSRPDIGVFVKNINLCPIMYNMCVGQTGNKREQCIIFERQCIDYTLDSFWRGAAQYTQQQYRSE